ncbi:MAG TPA: cytochrome P450 [Terriglobales bacterium]|nr:cytochrome P450 [Terriglobales bacterium]
MADIRETSGFFLDDPQKLDNPFPDFAYFREHHPVFYYPPLNSWFIFSYDDVQNLLRDDRLSADRMKGFVDAAPLEVRKDLAQLAPFLEKTALMKDGQDHARLREFLNLGFNPDRVRAMQGVIQQIVDELLDKVAAKGKMDVCGDLAFLLPAYVLSHMLGIHLEDSSKVVQWSVDFVDFFNVVPITVDNTRRLLASAFAMIQYTRSVIAERKAKPQDDFLGILVSAQAKGANFTEDDIVANAMLLLLAGHLAVRNLIGNAVYLLLTHPDQLELVRTNPSLLHNLIEETLRYETPITMIPRVALLDFDFRGQSIRVGQIVQLSIASANRDSAHFPDGECFNILRPAAKNLSFGEGPHGCLGALLAKEEAQIAIASILSRLKNLKIDDRVPIRWYRNAGNRGPVNLPVIFDPGGAAKSRT